MKTILVIMAAVVAIGCGKEKKEPVEHNRLVRLVIVRSGYESEVLEDLDDGIIYHIQKSLGQEGDTLMFNTHHEGRLGEWYLTHHFTYHKYIRIKNEVKP